MENREEEVIKHLSRYLTQQLKLCILATENQGEKAIGTRLYWVGAKSSAEALLELVTEDNLNDALVGGILEG